MSLPIVSSLANLLPEKWKAALWEILLKTGRVKPHLSDIGGSERLVEYGWVVRNIPVGSHTILDVGCFGTLFPIMLASLGFEVWGIDMRSYTASHPNFRFTKGDINTAALTQNYFDAITIISTIEHIGLNNDGDFACVKRLRTLLRPGGTILLTVPFGRSATFAGWRVYDKERLGKLLDGLKITGTQYAVEENGKWVNSTEAEANKFKATPKGKCQSIVCVAAMKMG
jgi:2-polyprenyl-3-methyl-5-hydroxy-6-metoxy-1,4-benzoquinol methylase